MNNTSLCEDKWNNLELFRRPEFYLLTILLVLFVLLVVVGNALVIAAVMLRRRLRSATGLLILSLAVADLFVGLFVLPLSISNEVLGDYWALGQIPCQFYLAVDVWMCTASIYNLVAISLDRYIAILKPLNYPMLVTKQRARIIIGLVWVSSFLICFPPMLLPNSGDDVPRADEECTCSPTNNEPYYIVYSATGSFFLPMGIIAFVYTRIYMAARAATKSIYSGMMAVSVNKPNKQPTPTSTPDSINKPMLRIHRGASVTSNQSSAGNGVPPLPRLALRRAESTTASGHRGSPECTADDESVSIKLKRRLSALGTGLPNSQRFNEPNGHLPFERQASRDSDNFQTARSNGSATVVEQLQEVAEQLQDMAEQLLGEGRSQHSKLMHTSANVENPTPTRHATIVNKKKKGRDGLDRAKASKASEAAATAKGWLRRIRETTSTDSDSSSGTPGGHHPAPADETRKAKLSSVGKLSRFIKRKTKRNNTDAYQKRLSLEIKAAKTVAIVTGCFICCWLGFAVLYVSRALPAFRCEGCIPPKLWSVAFWLGYVNSALNPIIYTVFNREFRTCFKRLLMCSKPNSTHFNSSWSYTTNANIKRFKAAAMANSLAEAAPCADLQTDQKLISSSRL